MTYINKATTVIPYIWRDGSKSTKGVRILSGGGGLFIPNSDILSLATDLADHLDNQKANANHSA